MNYTPLPKNSSLISALITANRVSLFLAAALIVFSTTVFIHLGPRFATPEALTAGAKMKAEIYRKIVPLQNQPDEHSVAILISTTPTPTVSPTPTISIVPTTKPTNTLVPTAIPTSTPQPTATPEPTVPPNNEYLDTNNYHPYNDLKKEVQSLQHEVKNIYKNK